jgi:hypothetical protein
MGNGEWEGWNWELFFLSSAPWFMTIHPLPADTTVPVRPRQERPDTTQSAYDSTWTERPETPSQQPTLDRIMGADGKIYVVLAVVLLIWIGLVTLLVRTDRKIDRLERRLDETGSQNDVRSETDE